MSELESLKDISKHMHGGARPGAGRPKGKANPATIERSKVKEAVLDRIHLNADKLLNAQMNKALGETYLMHKFTIGTGSKQRTETEIVTDPETIKDYLDDQLDTDNGEWYYMTTKPADNLALQGLFDRAFGKANATVENTGEQKLIVETRKHIAPKEAINHDDDQDD